MIRDSLFFSGILFHKNSIDKLNLESERSQFEISHNNLIKFPFSSNSGFAPNVYYKKKQKVRIAEISTKPRRNYVSIK